MNDEIGAGIVEAIREPYRLSINATAAPLGNGHINQTVLVHDNEQSLVAQRINTFVFHDPGALVHNARVIRSHLQRKGNAPKVVRHLAGDDGSYLHGPGGDVRVLEYIPGSLSIEVLESNEQAFEAAFTYAGFSRGLSDLDPGKLIIVIPDFHNPSMRYHLFLEALQDARVTQIEACRDDIKFVESTGSLIVEWQSLMDGLPVRICHNDCKINNVLINPDDGKALAVIDLDTSMPGYLMTDFGDLVRTCCNPEAEDSTLLERVNARPEVFTALARGYLKGLEGVILQEEIDSLVPGALMVCFIQGVRFLTDFLGDNQYYSVDYPSHNLDRARNQFQLFRSLQTRESELRSISTSNALMGRD
ncbi:MAG: aminoglycoside phosphotransferase family protein [Xanthomonadales bacterium]|nr:aminoglycoside phosphotransferase family protein [Xanthomonadales bacterium]MDH4021206.1 aminoglycoside phosphotransferase family protein [Xanthomonadales bacterium]